MMMMMIVVVTTTMTMVMTDDESTMEDLALMSPKAEPREPNTP